MRATTGQILEAIAKLPDPNALRAPLYVDIAVFGIYLNGYQNYGTVRFVRECYRDISGTTYHWTCNLS